VADEWFVAAAVEKGPARVEIGVTNAKENSIFMKKFSSILAHLNLIVGAKNGVTRGSTVTNILHASTSVPQKMKAQATKILLVEDSLANRDMLTRRLQRRGFVVCSAADGPTGVAMSVSEKPDLILMDVALGAMDGWEATQLIKGDLRTSHIPIIALTAHALATDREKSVEVGCADFDTKPVDLTRLLGKIEVCVARTRR
jgi:CheY-like chemotaxis protein